MKKLIIAAFAIASAFAVQAASVNWSMSYNVLPLSPDGSAMTAAGRPSFYTMYVFTADQSDAVNAALAAKNFSSVTALSKSNVQAAMPGMFSGVVNGLTGSSASLFAVVFDTASGETYADAGYYYVTGNVTQNTYDPTGSDPATEAVFSATQMTGEWKAVPEPTSGLLMLLGMAGLALRRRRV